MCTRDGFTIFADIQLDSRKIEFRPTEDSFIVTGGIIFTMLIPQGAIW